MERKYYNTILNLVKNHRRYPGLEDITDEIIEDVYNHAGSILNELTDSSVIETYLNKMVSTAIITVPRRLNHSSRRTTNNSAQILEKIHEKMHDAMENVKEEQLALDEELAEKEREEIQKAQKIKEVEENTANLENNLRKKAYEAAVEWVNAPTKPNTLKVEKYSKEADNYPEGMLCLASFWSYGDFNISSASQKNNQDSENQEQPETIIRVDPSLPPKGVYSTLLMSALHEGGTRKPVDRFVLYYEMGEKIACGKDNWTSEKVIKPNQEHPIAAPEKPKEKPIIKPADKPTYTKWKM